SRSGSAEVSSRSPPAYARCGPKRSMLASRSAGSAAMFLPLWGDGRGRRDAAVARFRFRPEPALRQAEPGGAAAGADPRVVPRRVVGQLVAVAERRLDAGEVLDVHARRGRLPAAAAAGLLRPLPDIFVKAHPELRRPLEDVEELPERQP